MTKKSEGLDYVIEEVEYLGGNRHGIDSRISITLYNRSERIPLVLTQEEYNSEIVGTRVAGVIAPSYLIWDGTKPGASELSDRLASKFLSNEDVENLRKYAKRKNSGTTKRERIKQFYGL